MVAQTEGQQPELSRAALRLLHRIHSRPWRGLLWVRSHKNKGVRATATVFSLLVSIGHNCAQTSRGTGVFQWEITRTNGLLLSVPAGKWDTSVPAIAAPQLRT